AGSPGRRFPVATRQAAPDRMTAFAEVPGRLRRLPRLRPCSLHPPALLSATAECWIRHLRSGCYACAPETGAPEPDAREELTPSVARGSSTINRAPTGSFSSTRMDP